MTTTKPKPTELIWEGDAASGYLGRAGTMIYTIIRQDEDWYEVRDSSYGDHPKDLSPKKLHYRYGQALNDPANRDYYRKTIGARCKTLTEAQAIAQNDADAHDYRLVAG